MDLEELEQRIKDFQAKDLPRILSRKAYSIGNHPGILQPAPKADPDNRKPVPFLLKAIEQLKGYMAKPGNIKYDGGYMATAQPIFDTNDEALTTAILLEDALRFGKSYELHWTNEQGEYEFYPIQAENSIPIYDNSIKSKMVGFIRYWKIGEIEYATYYGPVERIEYQKEKKWDVVEEGQHGFTRLPVQEYTVRRGRANIFDHVLPLIDLYDRLISEDVANELARYANALLVMAERIDAVTADDNGLTMIDKLKELRLLDGLGDGDVRSKVAFVTKDAPADFIKFAADTVERLIYEMLQVLNPSTLNTSDLSGVAMAYKLLPMEYLCASIEAYFSRGLQDRFKIIASNSLIGGDPSDVTITWHRNLPHNLLETAQIAATMTGTLSKQTIVRLFPDYVIGTVDEELARLEAEAPETVFTAFNGSVL